MCLSEGGTQLKTTGGGQLEEVVVKKEPVSHTVADICGVQQGGLEEGS